MDTRKLPPPVVFFSDQDKYAWMKNRKEHSRHNQVMDHIIIQVGAIQIYRLWSREKIHLVAFVRLSICDLPCVSNHYQSELFVYL